jgi:phosphoglycerate kinase
MPAFKTLDALAVAGKVVLLRADLNVPMQGGKVSDSTRIDRLVPTLRELTGKGAKVVMLSHFGRPKGGWEEEFSLRQIKTAIESALGMPVAFAQDAIGPSAEKAIADMPFGGVLLLENVRFHKGEEKNDPAFAKALAQLGDFYVNDAFSAAHRAHASTQALAQLLPCAAGRLMQAELDALGRALDNPARPLMAVVGGAKISTKLDLLINLVEKVDILALGGGMANTFLYAQGVAVGASLCERDMAQQAQAIMAKAAARGCEIILPVDFLVAQEFKAGAEYKIVPATAIPATMMALDIGPDSAAALAVKMTSAKSLVWNGPLGAFEIPPFDKGTNSVAKAAAKLSLDKKLLSVAGGGDTVAALANAGVVEEFSYVSTAGGAFLEWLEGKVLPGVAALYQTNPG